MKSGFITIIGRPSSGKSTLLNSICGHKVSIVSSVPQTTRNKVRGIYTTKEVQIVFVDTPGYHHSEKKFNIYMKDLVLSSMEDIEGILYVIDASRPPGKEEEDLIGRLTNLEDKLIIGINKVDIAEDQYTKVKDYCISHLNISEEKIFPISAKQKDGIEELIGGLVKLLPKGDLLYPEEYYTDQDPQFRISEIIREKAILKTKQEVPHSIYVEISDMEMREKKNMLWVRAFLTAETESQKGILIGKGGSVIKWIRQTAQKELNSIFPYKIHLDLRVKVNPKWRKKDNILRDLIQ
jgi:GTP-binding protein Era